MVKGNLVVAASAAERQFEKGASSHRTRFFSYLLATTLSILLLIVIVHGYRHDPVDMARAGLQPAHAKHAPAARTPTVPDTASRGDDNSATVHDYVTQRSFESVAPPRNEDVVERASDESMLDPDDGYSTPFDAPQHGYNEVYGTDMVVEMAKSGDRRALLQASMIASLPFQQRKTMAIAAAHQGYTAALMRLGGALLIESGRVELPSQMDEHLSLDAEDAIWGFALMTAARDLDDSGATAWFDHNNNITLSPAERRLAVPRAEAIVKAVTTRSLSDLLEAIES